MDIKQMLTKERLRTAFNVFDDNGDGSISFKEVKKIFSYQNIPDVEIQKLIKDMDTNKDGKISFEEF
jgi:calcium-dependent protein kinase